MSEKAKRTRSEIQEIYNALLQTETKFEADTVFHEFADKFNVDIRSIKNSFTTSAKWRLAEGDSSLLNLYNQLYGGKLNDVTSTLSAYTKKQKIEWIASFVDEPIPPLDHVQQTLEGGSNDAFFDAILSKFVHDEMTKFDNLWINHRTTLHWKIPVSIEWIKGLFILFALSILASIFLDIIFLSMTFVSLVGLALFTIKISTRIRTASLYEKYLIDETDKRIMNKFPNDFLKHLYMNWNKHFTMDLTIDSLNQELISPEEIEEHKKEMEATKVDIEERFKDKEIDFADLGLADAISVISPFKQTLPFFKNNTMGFIYRFLYRRVKGNFIDIENFKKGNWKEHF